MGARMKFLSQTEKNGRQGADCRRSGPSSGWIWSILLCVFMPMAGTPSATAQATAGEAPPLPPVRMDGNYFSRNGKRFIPVGVNWVPAKAGMEWPYEWDPASIEMDFAQMHSLGVNTVRLDLVWAWFEPRPGQYNEKAFQQLHFLSQLGRKYGIYLNPMLLIGGEVGEAYWDVPYRQGRDPQSDPEMLRLETDFAAELARRFAGDTSILAWDLTDEPPFWISADSTTDAMAINWARLIAGAIRKYDQQHPIVVGTSGQDIDHGPFRPDNLRDEVDFFSIHPYTVYEPKLFPDAMLSTRSTYGAAFETALSAGAGRPVMVQELGASTARYDPERIAEYDRTMMYSALGDGANGFLLWCYTDAAPEQYAKVPYLRAPNETQFGVVTWNRKEKPAAEMLQDFSRITSRLELNDTTPVQAQAAILVPDDWAKQRGDQSHFGLTGAPIVPYTSTVDGGAVAGQPMPSYKDENTRLVGAWLSSYIMSREAGLETAFPREYANWQKYRMLLLPAPLTGTDVALIHLHSDFWAKAETYVRQGGALYASVSGDAAIPNMAALFGARLADHIPVSDVTLRVVAPFGDLKPGETFHFTANDSEPNWAAILKVDGGTVIAVDAAGRPALVANRVGQGVTLLSAYPIEIYLAEEPSAFDKTQPAYRIYRALQQEASIAPLFTTGNAAVEASVIAGPSSGYVVLVNHSSNGQTIHLKSSSTPAKIFSVSASGEATITPDDGGWPIKLDPFSGVILHFEEK